MPAPALERDEPPRLAGTAQRDPQVVHDARVNGLIGDRHALGGVVAHVAFHAGDQGAAQGALLFIPEGGIDERAIE
jgi:hypothetical protein